ncbi:hypothetical protein ADL22_12215 [Streptomyces sp. NRRL F-4489]|uniref:hypothetical protein n=1 Tax=Streptomyces sp. NRRL F-4489 TaxID=1609095 RepID=UPI00074831C6|nr:hypothetical protein [Streptomyces sp. NRRL F-4489]KUL44701.1 hypothetical protein ADL22_12215 [Streptomyces sp. NRRL F-4489]
MAYIPRAPLTTELGYGACDGTIRKAAPNRGGYVERLTNESRSDTLEPRTFGSLGLDEDAAAARTCRYPQRSHQYA